MDKFLFGKKIKKEPEVLKTARDSHAKAMEDARRCLHSAPFKAFVKQYEVAERQTIDILIGLSKEEPDPLIFGNKAKDLLSNIAHLKAMLDVTHLKAGEKYGFRKAD